MADTKISAATLTTPETTDMIPMERSGSAVARYATVAGIVQAQAASTTAKGSVELATVAETQAGTSATLAVTPAGLLAVSEAVYNVTSYGAAGGSDSTSAIQAAMDAAGAAGGGVVYVPPSASAYLLTVAGTHTGLSGHKYCLKFNYDNITLYIEAGATLKLSDAQHVDGAPVDLIVGADLAHITITGGGTITGNTAGQSGWSGGYAQVSNGCLIYLWGTSGNGNSYITVSDLVLYDCFSNPVVVSAGAAYESEYIRLENLVCYAFGEGPAVEYSQHVIINNIICHDAADVAVGDGIQIEICKYVTATNLQVRTNGGGAAIETAGSQDVVISNFVVDGWTGGISIQGVNGVDTKHVTLSNGQILSVTTIGIEILETLATTTEYITLDNLVFRDCTTAGIFASIYATQITGPVTIKNCEVTGSEYGLVSYGGIKNFSIINSIFDANSLYGIYYAFGYGTPTTDETSGLYINGVKARNNGGWGILFEQAGHTTGDPSGLMANCDCTGNTTGAYRLVAGMTVENTLPNTVTAFSDTLWVAGYKYFTPILSPVKTFLSPSNGQQVIIRFVEATWHVIDKSQSGGVNIRLVGGVNFVPAAGNRMCLEYDEVNTEWVELWRRIN